MAHDVRLARFDAAPVFGRIGADDLDVERGHAGAFRHGAPRGPRERPRIDAVANDRPARTEVVLRHGVGDSASLTFHAIACPAQRLFDRVDPQVDRANRSRELSGVICSPADAAWPTEDEEHCCEECILRALASGDGAGRGRRR